MNFKTIAVPSLLLGVAACQGEGDNQISQTVSDAGAGGSSLNTGTGGTSLGGGNGGATWGPATGGRYTASGGAPFHEGSGGMPVTTGGTVGTGGSPIKGACSTAADCTVPEVTPQGCAEATCVSGRCAYQAKDEDGDHDRAASCSPNAASVTIETGNDCDDADPEVSSRLKEICDGKDNDCNGVRDDRVPVSTTSCMAGDGVCLAYGVLECENGTMSRCNATPKLPDGKSECDLVDHNCNGTIDSAACDCHPGDPRTVQRACAGDIVLHCNPNGKWPDYDQGPAKTTYCQDQDGDGYVNTSACGSFCPGTQPDRYTVPTSGRPGDCDDGRGNVSPNGQEVCDGLDNDCDGTPDEGTFTQCGCNVQVACGQACQPCPAGYHPFDGANCIADNDEPADGWQQRKFGWDGDPGGCGVSKDKAFGGYCGDGYVRTGFYVQQVASKANAHCEGYWADANDNTNCSVNVHFGTGACDTSYCDIQPRRARIAPRCQ